MPIGWLPREDRYVEKLATPDVTIADMVGDIDPIKAAHGGLQPSDELTMHYGLLPRANRGIFAINELPDLAGKIQVGLFNILQEGDVQIKGYPIRLQARRDAGLHREPRGLHGARQDHHAAQGPHRVGDPHALSRDARPRDGDHRSRKPGPSGPARSRSRSPTTCARWSRRSRSRRARTARSTSGPASASGCRSRTLEIVVSNAERRALAHGEHVVVAARHRHLRRAAVDHRQVRARIRRRAARRRAGRARADPLGGRPVFTGMFDGVDTRTVVEWFDLGGIAAAQRHLVGRRRASRRRAASRGCASCATHAGLAPGAAAPAVASAVDFVLEGPVRAEEDQPERRARLRRRRNGAAPRPAPRRS